MKKIIAVILLAVMLCTCFAACGSKSGANAPVVLNAGLQIIPTSLNCLEDDTTGAMSIAWCIYDRLVDFDNSGTWKPNIATSWEKVGDKTWNFVINLDKVKFQNGDKLTMEDVEYSIMRLKDFPKSADTGNKVESVSSNGNVLTINFVDTNNASPTSVLWTAVIVNKKYIEANGDDAIHIKPIGTGPWKVTEFVPTTSCKVETWKDYPFTKPQIDVINFSNMPDATTRYVAVETGQVQFADMMGQTEADLAKDNDKLYVLEKPSTTTMCFLMTNHKPPFDNVNVRRAMLYAMDRESMAEIEHGVPVKSVIFGGNDLYYKESDQLPEFDLEKAKQLLAEEGYDESNPLTFELVSTVSRACQELFQ